MSPYFDGDTSDEIADGHAAARILNDPVFEQAIDRAEAECIRRWRTSETIQERENAFAMQAALTAVVRELRSIMASGELKAHAQRNL